MNINRGRDAAAFTIAIPQGKLNTGIAAICSLASLITNVVSFVSPLSYMEHVLHHIASVV